VAQTKRHLWIWGAGHVGRALVSVLVGLPNFDITWVDVAPDRFPDISADALRLLAVPSPAVAVQLAPKTAEHLILTYSHALDLELCHQLLGHGFSHCGLIGSQTKWARFKSRLLQLGHARASIHQITCPIGDPSLGKHPQQIAIGVAASMINTKRATQKQESVG
jgi:xanthine dehydrogenase accessory factor